MFGLLILSYPMGSFVLRVAIEGDSLVAETVVSRLSMFCIPLVSCFR